MPLSEQEQRLLEEMERSLYQNDADFVATVSQRRGRPNYTRLVVGVLIAVAGVAALLVGVITRLPIVGVLGFAVMLTGAMVAFSPSRRAPAASDPGRPGRSSARGGSFMDRLNERWERREDERG